MATVSTLYDFRGITQKIKMFKLNPETTAESIHGLYWDDLKVIRKLPDEQLKSWEYADVLRCTERNHVNQKRSFDLLSWEQSYTLDFIYGIYH
jgi:hypothetical protein